MRVVVLAAGRGTRMGALTRDIPKAMIAVAGRPVLEHIITRLARVGLSDFILVTRYLAEKIERHFGGGERFGVSIRYASQGDYYGTGAALLSAEDYAAHGPLMMTYGDIITPVVNYSRAMETFSQSQCAAVMTLNWMDDPWAGGAVHVDENGRVSRIVEKPPKGQIVSHWNSAGIMVFDPVIFGYLERLRPSPRGEYELPDALNAMIDDGLAIHPYYLRGGWCDVGRPEDIAAAEEILRQEERHASPDL